MHESRGAYQNQRFHPCVAPLKTEQNKWFLREISIYHQESIILTSNNEDHLRVQTGIFLPIDHVVLELRVVLVFQDHPETKSGKQAP